MKPDAFVIGVVLFSLVIIIGANMILDLSSTYDVDYEADFLDNYTQDFENYTSSGKVDVGITEGDEDNWWDRLTRGVSGFFNRLWTPIGMVVGMMSYATIKLGAPPEIAEAFSFILFTLVIFAIGYIIFRIRSW